MDDHAGAITLKLQMSLNKRMFETGRIPYALYSKANEVLSGKLTDSLENGMMIGESK